MSLEHDKLRGKAKSGNKTKCQITELPQAMFPMPTRKGAVSMATLRQISPSNPESRGNFHLALHLVDARELAQTIHNEGLVAIRSNTNWLKVFTLLEQVIDRQDLSSFLGRDRREQRLR